MQRKFGYENRQFAKIVKLKMDPSNRDCFLEIQNNNFIRENAVKSSKKY